MFGIKKGNEWVNINNSIFNVMVYNYIKGEQNQLFFATTDPTLNIGEFLEFFHSFPSLFVLLHSKISKSLDDC